MGIFRYTWRTFTRELVLLAVAAVWWVPFYFLVMISLKSDSEVFTQSAGALPKSLAWGNYSAAWRGNTSLSL